MSPRSKKEYVEAIFLRYKHASRKEKTTILYELCSACGYHRKYAIKRLKNFKRFTKSKPKKRGRPPRYNTQSVLKPFKKYGEKGKRGYSNKYTISKKRFLSPCLASIATMVQSSSITISSDILPKETNPVSSPEADPTIKMITRMSKKNWTYVRQWLGYERLDNPEAVPLLNALYTQETETVP